MPTYRILLVEDIYFNQILMESLLADWGYSVANAHNGAEGLEAIEKENFDLIILDLMMPVMDGYDFLKKKKEKNNSSLVLIVSARHDMESIERALSFGANDYITKPFNSIDLENKIKSLLNSK